MELKDIGEAIERGQAAMLAALAQRDQEIKDLGGAKQKTAETVDKLGNELLALQAEQTKAHNELLAEIRSGGVRMDEIEKKLGRASVGNHAIERGAHGIAHDFVASDAYKAFADQRRGLKSTDKILVKSLFPYMTPQAVKATFGLGSVDGDLVVPQRTDPVSAQLRQLRIRDLLPVRPMTSNSISYLEETAFTTDATTGSVSSITRSSTTATATASAAHGLTTGDLVRIAGADQDEYNGDHYVTVTGATTFTFTVDSGATTPATGTITWKQLNSFGAAGMVAEGGLKPEALLELVEREVSAKVIAHYLKITKQAAEDAPQIVAYIEDRLLYGVAFKEEQQILYGSGSGENLQGIMTHPRVQTYDWSDGEVGDTKVDAIRRAMTRAQVREFVPTGGVVNPLDFEDIELAKGDDLHYIWTAAPENGAGTRIWRVPFVVTNAMLEGDFLVGAFGSGGATLWDREEANVQIATENEDDFIRNRRTLLAEERVALAIQRPDSFVAGNFDAAPSA